jgi:hypothetical protein
MDFIMILFLEELLVLLVALLLLVFTLFSSLIWTIGDEISKLATIVVSSLGSCPHVLFFITFEIFLLFHEFLESSNEKIHLIGIKLGALIFFFT